MVRSCCDEDISSLKYRCLLLLVRDGYFCECISLGWYNFNINHQFDFVWSLIVV